MGTTDTTRNVYPALFTVARIKTQPIQLSTEEEAYCGIVIQ